MKRLLKIFLIAAALLITHASYGQFADSTTGLLNMPSAEMQPSGTFMITNSYLNKHHLASNMWGYDTFSYGFDITFWSRLEIGYVCVIFDGKRRPNGTARDKIMFNQDRHFLARFNVLREGELWKYAPSIVVGISDPVTGAGGGDYTDGNIGKVRNNGFFNRMYVVATKHFDTPWGNVGVNAGYQYNLRRNPHYNAPCAAVTWEPVWIQNLALQNRFRLIAEYDSLTFNMGFVAGIWKDHFDAMFEWHNLRWVNASLRYKVILH